MILEVMTRPVIPGEWVKFKTAYEINVPGLDGLFWTREISVIIPKSLITRRFTAFREKADAHHAYDVTGWTEQGEAVLVSGRWRTFDFTGLSLNDIVLDGTIRASNAIFSTSDVPRDGLVNGTRTPLYSDGKFSLIVNMQYREGSSGRPYVGSFHFTDGMQTGGTSFTSGQIQLWSYYAIMGAIDSNKQIKTSSHTFNIEKVISAYAVPYNFNTDLNGAHGFTQYTVGSGTADYYHAYEINTLYAEFTQAIIAGSSPIRDLVIYPENVQLPNAGTTITAQLTVFGGDVMLAFGLPGSMRDVSSAFSLPFVFGGLSAAQANPAGVGLQAVTSAIGIASAGAKIISGDVGIGTARDVASVAGQIKGVADAFRLPGASPASLNTSLYGALHGFVYVQNYTSTEISNGRLVKKNHVPACERTPNYKPFIALNEGQYLYLQGDFFVPASLQPEAAAECAGELAAGVWIYG